MQSVAFSDQGLDDARFDRLYRIGVDGISSKRGHKFLTIVADHDTGNVVWIGKEQPRTPANLSSRTDVLIFGA